MTDAVHSKSEVWLSERQVLQTANDTPIQSRIFKGSSIKSSERASGRHRGRNRLGRVHVGLFEQILNIFALREKTRSRMVDFRAKEVMELTKVLDRKGQPQGGNKRADGRRVRIGDDDVIDIHQKINQ